jgi:(4-(4-[2-(gamma-L-glutamylamino)ethyl]phenoxymethyl)furan-2-yl)methanamine synthase
MSWLGLDIGGANLKVADGHGWASSWPFALWREPERLADVLDMLLAHSPPARRLAITMTGELCDCFRTKSDGVQQILDAVERAASHESWVYLVDGRMVTLKAARKSPHLAAASNWHALARFGGRFMERQTGLLIDVGSTTTDIVPIVDGRPRPCATNDTERLVAAELVYTGVGRTPVCAVLKSMPWRGRECPVAAELFATAADAYVVLGELGEDLQASWAADGRPLTVEFARERLARMICADATAFSIDDARQAAARIREAQIAQLLDAVRRSITGRASPECVVISGVGEFLARRVVEEGLPSSRVVSLQKKLGSEVSACAPAHALAVLAAEELGL